MTRPKPIHELRNHHADDLDEMPQSFPELLDWMRDAHFKEFEMMWVAAVTALASEENDLDLRWLVRTMLAARQRYREQFGIKSQRPDREPYKWRTPRQ